MKSDDFLSAPSSVIPHCINCSHFHRHREIVRGPYWSDELMEVDSIGGDCRCNPPVAHWMTGKAVWPFVLTGHSCSHFSPNAKIT